MLQFLGVVVEDVFKKKKKGEIELKNYLSFLFFAVNFKSQTYKLYFFFLSLEIQALIYNGEKRKEIRI